MSLNLNENAWYQINATKFPGHSLLGTSLFNDGLNGAIFIDETNTSKPGQRWQFYPHNSSVYVLRCQDGGPTAYLSAAKGRGDSSDHAQNVTGDTSPYMSNASIADGSMFWQVGPWDDGTYHLSNLANGSDWRMNTQDSGLLVMDSNITTEQVGEHFIFSSMSAIDNSQYSSAYIPSTASQPAATPTDASNTGESTSRASSSVSATVSSSSSSNELSAGAAAGIGAGIGALAIIIAVLFGFFFFRKRRAAKVRPARSAAYLEHNQDGVVHETADSGFASELQTTERRAEAPGDTWKKTPMELAA